MSEQAQSESDFEASRFVVPFRDLSVVGKVQRLQRFFSHLLISSILPFSPLIIEETVAGVRNESIIMSVCMYIITVAMLSRHDIFLTSGVFSLLCLLPAYAVIVMNPSFGQIGFIVQISVIVASFMTVSNIIIGFDDYILKDRRIREK